MLRSHQRLPQDYDDDDSGDVDCGLVGITMDDEEDGRARVQEAAYRRNCIVPLASDVLETLVG